MKFITITIQHQNFILYENTIDDFYNTISILKYNNIQFTVETDELNLDTILI